MILFFYLFSIRGTALESDSGSISDFTDILRKKESTLESVSHVQKENEDSGTLRRIKKSFCLENMWTQKRREDDLARRDWTRSEHVTCSSKNNPMNEPHTPVKANFQVVTRKYTKKKDLIFERI